MPEADLVHRALALAALLRTEDSETARACLALAEDVAAGMRTELTSRELTNLLEDRRIAAPAPAVWDALVACGLFAQDGSRLRASGAIPLARAYASVAPRDDVAVDVRATLSWLREPESAPTPSASVRAIAQSVQRTRDWGRSLLAYAAREELPGFPVFWELGDDAARPFGSDFGSLAASDTILLSVEAARYGLAAVPDTSGERQDLVRAWRGLLDLGVHADGDWYDGAVRFPGFDDDFVGAFVPELAAKGSCPTVEAIAIRTYALVRLVQVLGEREPQLASVSVEAIARSVRCLARWQDESGGWAIHRYPGADASGLPIRDVSSRYAVDALLAALGRGMLAAEDAGAAGLALARFADLLVRSAQPAEAGGMCWSGDFVRDEPEHRLRATATFALSLGSLAVLLRDARLQELEQEAVRFIDEVWEPDPHGAFVVEFRAPTWAGPALTGFSWELPADALVVLPLMDCAARGVELSASVTERVERAVAQMVETQVGGAWLDVKMAEGGLRNAFTSNTLQIQRALLAALAWQGRALPAGLGPGLLAR